MTKKLTTEEFIARAKAKHGDKYDYSNSVYIDSQTKLEIGCPIHGLFDQRPNDHYRYGCRSCGRIISSNKQMKTKKQFITDAQKIHGDKYNYDESDYKGDKIKIKIGCPIHGSFEQKPGNHLQGQGCNDCANNQLSIDRRMTIQDFIKKGRQIHGDNIFDYSEIKNLKNLQSYVPLKCNICQSKFEILAKPGFLQNQN
jgi:hypothetical protein